MYRHGIPALLDAVDLDLGPSDHEVGVDRRLVEARLAILRVGPSEIEAVSESHVARGVLVIQRVPEDDPQLSDPRLFIDQGDLAQVRRTGINRDLGPD